MKLLVKKRGTGKTTGLIYASEATGYPIVVHNEVTLKLIEDMAKQLGCKIPEPMTVHELRKRGRYFNKPVLLDELAFVLEDALQEYLGTEVICATMSYEGE